MFIQKVQLWAVQLVHVYNNNDDIKYIKKSTIGKLS